MSDRSRRESLFVDVLLLVGGIGSAVAVGGVRAIVVLGVGAIAISAIFGGVGVNVLAVLAVPAVLTADSVRRLREWRAPTRFSPVPVPRSLRWVRGLLPGDEGAAWWGEVASCLAETPDPGERRRYVRSYRRNVPQLIWTSWAEHLSASRQRELL